MAGRSAAAGFIDCCINCCFTDFTPRYAFTLLVRLLLALLRKSRRLLLPRLAAVVRIGRLPLMSVAVDGG